MRHPQGFAPRLARAGLVIAATLAMMFSTVPVAADAAGHSADQDVAEAPVTPDATEAPSSTPSETPIPAEAADPTEPSDPTPRSVPRPGGNDAVITVKVGGDRSSARSVKGLSGVKLRLHTGGSDGPGTALRDRWASCTSDADGDCSFTVPETGQDRSCLLLICSTKNQANRDRQFWVVQESAPAGWSMNERFLVGRGDRTSTEQYAFRTGNRLRAGSTYRSGADFMKVTNRDDKLNSTGTWQNTRRNPSLEVSCSAGLRVALVLDLSGSVSNSGALGTLKKASKGMVDALKGTSSSMALYTFSSDAPRNSSNDGRNWPAMSIDPNNNAETIKSRIDAYDTGGGTNWDSALWQVASAADPYDIVVVVTDGMPTYSYGNTSGGGSTTSFDEIEAAVFSANAVKAKGSRVMAVGVGKGISSGGTNLAAISGSRKYSDGESINDADYFQTGWEELADLMAAMATGATCRADIEIVKKSVAYGATSPNPGGAGWTFSATASAPGALSPSAEQTTGENSKVGYQVKFSTPKPAKAAKVSIEELLSDKQIAQGWKLDAVDCRVNGKSVPVSAKSIGFDVTVGDAVKCTVTNKQTLKPGISIEKTAWDTPSAAGLETAKELRSGASVTDGRTLTWTYLVTNTGRTPLEKITVVDDKLPASAVKCPKTRLSPGESMTCSASGAVTK